MNILYVYAHPNSTSFNHELKEVGLKKLKEMGHDLKISDLYGQDFEAMASMSDFDKNNLSSEIKKEMEKIAWADHIIFQFPLWWFSVPAVLKGWFDRVFVKGFAYDTERVFSTGLLKGRTAFLVVTTQSPEEAYQKEGIHGEEIESFLLSIHHTLRFAGVKMKEPFVSYGVFNLEENKSKVIFEKYKNYLEKFLSIK